MDQAKCVTVWGTGNALREFMFVDDMVDACLFIHDLDHGEFAKQTEETVSHINIGSGEEISIKELAERVQVAVGYKGKIQFDPSKPDGTPRKRLDVTKLDRLGWRAKTTLKEGLKVTYDSFLSTLIS